MNKGTLKPEFYDDIRSVWQRQRAQAALKKGVDVDEDALAAVAQMKGWEILKAHINNLKIGLDARLSTAIASGMTESEIGKSAVMTTLGKELLDSIINKVEDSALAVEEIVDENRKSAGE